jgi:hypothetical protein
MGVWANVLTAMSRMEVDQNVRSMGGRIAAKLDGVEIYFEEVALR